MKHKIKSGVCLLLAAMLCVGGVGCGTGENGEPGNENKPTVNGNEITLKTKDAAMTLEAGDTHLAIKSLKSAGGKEAVPAPSEFSLPNIIRTDAGKVKVTWDFVSAKTEEGTENGVGFQSAVFSFRGRDLPAELTVTVLARPTLPGPFEVRSQVKNTSDSPIRLLPGKFASLNVGQGGELVSIKKESGMSEGYTHYDGQHFDGTGIYRTEANADAAVSAWVSTLQNFNASGYLPMVYLDKTDYGVYCALEWSCGRVRAAGEDDVIRFSVDLDEVSVGGGSFATTVPAKTAFDLPSVYFGIYDGTLDDGSNAFKHWFFSCKAPSALRDNGQEPLSQMDMQSGLETHGVESIKWDYGWWSEDALGGWKSLEGSWALRSSAYQQVLAGYGLGTLADFGGAAKEHGLNWTVYLLLHDTLDASGNPTDAYGPFNSVTHPEWFSDRLIADGMGRSADLGNAECVEYLKEALSSFFADNKIGTWRSDFEPICYSSDKENRHDKNGTDVMYWCTVGFRDVVKHLYETVDGFRYESCSSGGSMKDLFTATLAVSINTDDAANYAGMRATFYDSSYVIHPAQLQMPCNSDFANPEAESFWPKVSVTVEDGFDFQKAMTDMGFRTQCLGSPMFSSWTGTCLVDSYEIYSKMYAEKIRPLVRNGELYHILPRPDGVHYDGVMYADADAESEIKGLVFLFKPSEEAGASCHLTLSGLNAEKTYRVQFEDRPEQNFTATGAKLMEAGFDASIPHVGSELIWICEP